VWDLKTLELSYTLPVHTGVVNSISLRNDGRRIASAGADKFVTLSLLDLEELKQTAQRMKVRDFTESERSRYLIQRASKQNA
jgi:WD40 repeat protein